MALRTAAEAGHSGVAGYMSRSGTRSEAARGSRPGRDRIRGRKTSPKARETSHPSLPVSHMPAAREESQRERVWVEHKLPSQPAMGGRRDEWDAGPGISTFAIQTDHDSCIGTISSFLCLRQNTRAENWGPVRQLDSTLLFMLMAETIAYVPENTGLMYVTDPMSGVNK